MTLFHPLFPWHQYGEAIQKILLSPKYRYDSSQNQPSDLIIYVHKEEKTTTKSLSLYLILDEQGVILSARHRTYGPTSLMALIEITCHLIEEKSIHFLDKISPEYMHNQIKNLNNKNFPLVFLKDIKMIIALLQEAKEKSSSLISSTDPSSNPIKTIPSTHWNSLKKKEKLAILENIIDQEIRPFLEADGGGIEIIDFIVKNNTLLFAYKGRCAFCPSALSSTLHFIEHTLSSHFSIKISLKPTNLQETFTDFHCFS